MILVLPVSIGEDSHILQDFMAQTLDIQIIANVFNQFKDQVRLIESLDVVSRAFPYQMVISVIVSINQLWAQKSRSAIYSCNERFG